MVEVTVIWAKAYLAGLVAKKRRDERWQDRKWLAKLVRETRRAILAAEAAGKTGESIFQL